ncbi:MAG: hypothetical protein U0324_04905 [Polyangiales bacterium]
MRASTLLGLFAAAAFGCADDPKPLTGQASWTDGCPMNACVSGAHSVRGAQGSPTVDVECALAPASGGYTVFFRIAALAIAGQSFDESREGLYALGFLPGVGRELQVSDGAGYVRVRGNGWEVRNATLGASGACHVFVDTVANGGFTGRINCEGMRDDATPPNTRFIRGNAGAAMANFGEFVFTNCATTTP